MFDQNVINDISDKINQFIPDDLKRACADIDKNIKTAVQGALAKVDMVTREEFDAQCAVLARTRQKLEALERQLAEFTSQQAD